MTPVDWADRGATGLVGTAADLLKWAHAVRGGRVLSQAARDELERGHVFVRHEENGDVYYGSGARVYMQDRHRREVWLSGYDVRVGHSSAVRLLDNGVYVVALSNAGLDATGERAVTGRARTRARERPRHLRQGRESAPSVERVGGEGGADRARSLSQRVFSGGKMPTTTLKRSRYLNALPCAAPAPIDTPAMTWASRSGRMWKFSCRKFHTSHIR